MAGTSQTPRRRHRRRLPHPQRSLLKKRSSAEERRSFLGDLRWGGPLPPFLCVPIPTSALPHARNQPFGENESGHFRYGLLTDRLRPIGIGPADSHEELAIANRSAGAQHRGGPIVSKE